MSKKGYNKVKENLDNPKPTQEEVLENLKKDFLKYKELTQKYEVLSYKVQGAIEVLEQLLEKDAKE
jgi:hypothetical protein